LSRPFNKADYFAFELSGNPDNEEAFFFDKNTLFILKPNGNPEASPSRSVRWLSSLCGAWGAPPAPRPGAHTHITERKSGLLWPQAKIFLPQPRFFLTEERKREKERENLHRNTLE